MARRQFSWPPPVPPLPSPSVTVPNRRDPTSRAKALHDRATKGVDRTEARRLAGVPIATARRFVEIDGRRLASLLTLGLLVATFPLIILLYAFGSTSAGHGGSLGDALVTQFGITGRDASTVRSTVASASASRQSATVLTILGLVYGGLDIAVVVHTTFAHAFRIPPMAGCQRVMRGLLWFFVLVLNLLLTEAIQSNLLDRGIALRVLAIVIQGWLAFAFWLATPVLLLHRRPGAARLVPMALAGTGITFLTRLASKAWVRHLIDGYVTPSDRSG